MDPGRSISVPVSSLHGSPSTLESFSPLLSRPFPSGKASHLSSRKAKADQLIFCLTHPTGGWNDGSDACAKVGQYMRGTGAIFKKKGGEIMNPEKWCRHPLIGDGKHQDPDGVVMDFDFLQAPLITNWFFKHYVRHAVRTASGNNPHWDFHCQSQCGSMPLRSFIDHPPIPPLNGEFTLDQGNSSFTDDPDDPDDPPEDTWTSWFFGPPRGRMCFPYPPR